MYIVNSYSSQAKSFQKRGLKSIKPKLFLKKKKIFFNKRDKILGRLRKRGNTRTANIGMREKTSLLILYTLRKIRKCHK